MNKKQVWRYLMSGSGRYYENKWVGEWDSIVKLNVEWNEEVSQVDSEEKNKTKQKWHVQRPEVNACLANSKNSKETSVLGASEHQSSGSWGQKDSHGLEDQGKNSGLNSLWSERPLEGFGKTDTNWFVFWKKNSIKCLLKCGAIRGNSGNRENSRRRWKKKRTDNLPMNLTWWNLLVTLRRKRSFIRLMETKTLYSLCSLLPSWASFEILVKFIPLACHLFFIGQLLCAKNYTSY